MEKDFNKEMVSKYDGIFQLKKEFKGLSEICHVWDY